MRLLSLFFHFIFSIECYHLPYLCYTLCPHHSSSKQQHFIPKILENFKTTKHIVVYFCQPSIPGSFLRLHTVSNTDFFSRNPLKYEFEERERERERETGRIDSRSLGDRKKHGRNDDRRNVILQVKKQSDGSFLSKKP